MDTPIEASQAFLAVSHSKCWKCDQDAAVVCLYVTEGLVDGEPMTSFSVSNITEIDDLLKKILIPYPNFREAHSVTADMAYFANHCSSCGTLQGDYYLHSKPGGAFFPETSEEFEQIRFQRIVGSVQLDGDVGMGAMQRAFEYQS